MILQYKISSQNYKHSQNRKKKKNYIGISVSGYENKEKHPIYVSKKCCEEKHVDLLLIGREKDTMFLLKILKHFHVWSFFTS